jgi:hypothetical protein
MSSIGSSSQTESKMLRINRLNKCDLSDKIQKVDIKFGESNSPAVHGTIKFKDNVVYNNEFIKTAHVKVFLNQAFLGSEVTEPIEVFKSLTYEQGIMKLVQQMVFLNYCPYFVKPLLVAENCPPILLIQKYQLQDNTDQQIQNKVWKMMILLHAYHIAFAREVAREIIKEIHKKIAPEDKNRFLQEQQKVELDLLKEVLKWSNYDEPFEIDESRHLPVNMFDLSTDEFIKQFFKTINPVSSVMKRVYDKVSRSGYDFKNFAKHTVNYTLTPVFENKSNLLYYYIQNIIQQSIPSSTLYLIFLQISIAIYSMGLVQLNHNDLHFLNIYLQPVETSNVRFTYYKIHNHVLTFRKDLVKFNVLLFDFDMAYCPIIGNNSRLQDRGEMCSRYNICNSFHPLTDFAKVFLELVKMLFYNSKIYSSMNTSGTFLSNINERQLTSALKEFTILDDLIKITKCFIKREIIEPTDNDFKNTKNILVMFYEFSKFDVIQLNQSCHNSVWLNSLFKTPVEIVLSLAELSNVSIAKYTNQQITYRADNEVARYIVKNFRKLIKKEELGRSCL